MEGKKSEKIREKADKDMGDKGRIRESQKEIQVAGRLGSP